MNSLSTNFNSEENIGYVAWGTKRGLSYFFSSAHIDTNSNDTRDTLKDIRAIVRFAAPKIDYYSMVFTPQHRVYTQYRSLYDWLGREGYVAMTIYIPHFLKPDDGATVQLLNDTVNYYWDNYINEAYQIKKDIKENKTWFDNAVCIPVKKDRGLNHFSTRNEIFGLVRYKDKNELSIYFDNPYHREYYQYQEILFIQNELQFSRMHILNINPVMPRYSVKFISSEANVNSEFFVNGEAVEDLNNLLTSDDIRAIFTRPYHQSLSWQGSIEQLMQQSQNSMRDNTILVNLPAFIPYRREIQFSVKDAKTNLPISDFSIAVNNQIIKNSKVILQGRETGKDLKCIFSADNYEDFEQMIPGAKPDDKNFRNPKIIDINMQPLEKIQVSVVCMDAYTNRRLGGITVSYAGTELVTNTNGEVYFHIAKKDSKNNPSYTLRITGKGYEVYEQFIHVNELINTFYVKLFKTKTSDRLPGNTISYLYSEENTAGFLNPEENTIKERYSDENVVKDSYPEEITITEYPEEDAIDDEEYPEEIIITNYPEGITITDYPEEVTINSYSEGITINDRYSEARRNAGANPNAGRRENKDYRRVQTNDKNEKQVNKPSGENRKSLTDWFNSKLLIISISILSIILIFLIVLLVKILSGSSNDDNTEVITIAPGGQKNDKNLIDENLPTVKSENDTVTITLRGTNNTLLNPKNFDISAGSQELIRNNSTIMMVFTPGQSEGPLKIRSAGNYQDTTFRVQSTSQKIDLVLKEKKNTTDQEINKIKDILKRLNDFDFTKNDLEKWSKDIKDARFTILNNKASILSGPDFSLEDPVSSIIDNINELKKLCDKLYAPAQDTSLTDYFRECRNNDNYTYTQKRKLLRWSSLDNRMLSKILMKKNKENMTVSEIMKVE